MKKLKPLQSDYDTKLDNIIKPDEDTLFNSVEDVQSWLREVIALEDDVDNSI